jgi:hypothetical protein
MPKPEVNLPVPELVSAIVEDPNKPAGVVLLSGFPGPASESGHTRLYFDPLLSQYVEIPNEAIVYFQPMRSGNSPEGGVYVWVQREAQLVHAKAGPERTQAKFFEGPIAQAVRPTVVQEPSIGGAGGGCDTPACTGPHVTCWLVAPPVAGMRPSIGGVGGGCDTPACTGAHVTCWQAPFAAASIGGAGGGCDTPACTGPHITCWQAPFAATPGRLGGPWPTNAGCPTMAACAPGPARGF